MKKGARFDLDTFEGRTGFDAMVEQYIAMDQDVADYDPDFYSQEVWENLEFTNDLEAWEEGGIDFVNDLEEARARIFVVVRRVLAEEQEWRAITE